MHLYIVTRGIKHDVDRFISDLQAQYFPYYPKDMAIPPQPQSWIQLSVRPVQFHELVFPETALPAVMKMIGMCKQPDGKIGEHKFMNKYFTTIRKIMKLKKIPDLDLSNVPQRLLYQQNTAVYPIGIKDDDVWKDGRYKGFETI